MADQINSDAVPQYAAKLQGDEKVRITVEEWGAKARDKKECYHQVAHVFGAYVPEVDHITSWHLRDLCTGTKKMIKGTEVKYLHVPHYEHLSVEDFLTFLEQYPFAQMCLPDRKKEIMKLGRQYIINVIFTRVGQKFKDWVDERVNHRHEEVKLEGKKYIELDRQCAEVFYSNKAVSTKKGCSYHMFKASA